MCIIVSGQNRGVSGLNTNITFLFNKICVSNLILMSTKVTMTTRGPKPASPLNPDNQDLPNTRKTGGNKLRFVCVFK